MKKIWGSIVFGFAKLVDLLFGGLVWLFDKIVLLSKYLTRILIPVLLLMGLSIFALPLMLIFLMTPGGLTLIAIILLVLIVAFIGRKAVSSLKYYRYITTEYLYDYADFYRLGKGKKGKFSDYSSKYRRKQQEEKRREQEERRREQEERQRAAQEEWQRRFEEFFRTYRQQGGGSYSSNQGGYQSTYNPYTDFVSQYRKSCDILGLKYDTDIYEVKLQYRKLAKKYHPDLNKDEKAADKFKEITSAYEFLSEENIERYKRMKEV